MNIIIPAAGKGERFIQKNINTPKPLIKIFGKEMILYVLDNLYFNQEDKIFIIYYNIEDIEDIVLSKYNNLKFIKLNNPTKGAAETLLMGLPSIISQTNYKKTILFDCDTFYTEDILSIYREIDTNVVFYTKNDEETPLYSYISFDDNTIITDIKEKVKISNNANTGAYGFKDIYELYHYSKYIIKNKITFHNEY